MSERAMPAWPADPEWPRWFNGCLVDRLVDIGMYAIRTVDGVRMAEPVDRVGPAYVEDPTSGWWEYVYDVATGDVRSLLRFSSLTVAQFREIGGFR
jgi:hypothetical protein